MDLIVVGLKTYYKYKKPLLELSDEEITYSNISIGVDMRLEYRMRIDPSDGYYV